MKSFEEIWKNLVSWKDACFSDDPIKKWAARIGVLFIIVGVLYYLTISALSLLEKAQPYIPAAPSKLKEAPPEEPPQKVISSGVCDAVLRASNDYDLEDVRHQQEAWALFEKALLALSSDKRDNLDMNRVKEAQRYWKAGDRRRGLTKMVSAFESIKVACVDSGKEDIKNATDNRGNYKKLKRDEPANTKSTPSEKTSEGIIRKDPNLPTQPYLKSSSKNTD